MNQTNLILNSYPQNYALLLAKTQALALALGSTSVLIKNAKPPIRLFSMSITTGKELYNMYLRVNVRLEIVQAVVEKPG